LPNRSGWVPLAFEHNRFYMYDFLGRLGMLATSYELEATDPNAQDFEQPPFLTQNSVSS
jgi:glutamate--cysteine ligase